MEQQQLRFVRMADQEKFLKEMVNFPTMGGSKVIKKKRRTRYIKTGRKNRRFKRKESRKKRKKRKTKRKKRKTRRKR